VDDVHAVLLGHVVKRRLAVDVLVLEGKAYLQEQVETAFLALAADVEEDGLLAAVLEVRVGAVVQQQLHDFVALLVVDQGGCEEQGGLPGLRFQPVHDDGLVLVEVGLHGLDGAA
jgi:hypothetical protein